MPQRLRLQRHWGTFMDTEIITRRKEAARLIGVSLRSLDRWERAGQFPKRIRLGPRAVGYSTVEVNDWLARRRQQDQ